METRSFRVREDSKGQLWIETKDEKLVLHVVNLDLTKRLTIWDNTDGGKTALRTLNLKGNREF